MILNEEKILEFSKQLGPFLRPFLWRVPLSNITPKSLVTLQFLKCLIFQIKAYIQGFQMRYQSFLGHWYTNSYS